MEPDILVNFTGCLQIIKINRPSRRNAMTLETYTNLRKALKDASENEEVRITLVTGVGEYFSNGNDFSSVNAIDDCKNEDLDSLIRRNLACFREFIRSLIDHPKILVALINGPALGAAVTMLAHFDLIYATNDAMFQTPFTSLGLCAEGCSSFTFPRTLGKSLAAKMLYFNYKMSAAEAKDCGFVADIFAKEDVPKLIEELQHLGKLPMKSLMYTKEMIRSHDRKSLHYANTMEIEHLVERIQSDEFFNAIINMRSRKDHKSKL